MTTRRILIVEDDSAVREMLVMAVSNAGYQVDEAAETHTARKIISDRQPDLILLDWMLPGQSGVAFAKALKNENPDHPLPIILLTARGSEADKIQGLESGADDYVTKPFSILELLARIKAVLRRGAPVNQTSTEFEGLSLDLDSQRISAGAKLLELAPMEYALLSFFIQNPEKAYNRSQLLDHVWGTDVYVDERTVDVHVQRLRKILESYGRRHLLQTVRGVGYRFSARD